MLEDFPGTSASEPALPPPDGPAGTGSEALPRVLRLGWFLVPAALLGFDLLLALWNQVLRTLAGGGLGMAFAWLPWLAHTGLVLGIVAWIWSRRPWPSGVQAALLLAGAVPLLRFGVSQVLFFAGGARYGGLGGLLTVVMGPLLGLALAALVAALDSGGDGDQRQARTLGGLAAAVPAALAGGWFTWALLPLFASLLGGRLARRMAEPGEPGGEASAPGLRATGWLALGSALAAAVVPLVGLLKFRGAMGTLLGSEGLALALGAITWNVLGLRWARGRSVGRVLRIAAWLVLAFPVLLVAGVVVLLLVFKPRLF